MTRNAEDPNNTENTYGRRLKALRKRAGLTLKELASMTDLSPSFISKLEAGKVGISVTNMDKIATAFGISAGRLVRTEERKKGPLVVRQNRGDRTVVNENILYERVGPDDPYFGLSATLVRSLPGDTTGDMTTHLGDEIRYVLHGKFRFWVDEMVYDLEAGDTLSHSSDLPHRWENVGSEEGVFLVVSTMPRV